MLLICDSNSMHLIPHIFFIPLPYKSTFCCHIPSESASKSRDLRVDCTQSLLMSHTSCNHRHRGQRPASQQRQTPQRTHIDGTRRMKKKECDEGPSAAAHPLRRCRNAIIIIIKHFACNQTSPGRPRGIKMHNGAAHR